MCSAKAITRAGPWHPQLADPQEGLPIGRMQYLKLVESVAKYVTNARPGLKKCVGFGEPYALLKSMYVRCILIN